MAKYARQTCTIDLMCDYDTLLDSVRFFWPPQPPQVVIHRDVIADNWLARWRQRIGYRHYKRTGHTPKWPMWGRWRLVQFEGELAGVEAGKEGSATLTVDSLAKTIDVVLPRYMDEQTAAEWYKLEGRHG